MLTVFEKIDQNKIQLTDFSEHQKSLIMGMLKMAFNDGIDHQKKEQSLALQEINQCINSYLENNL